MTNVVRISWKKGEQIGVVDGIIATHTLPGARYRITSIDYRVIAEPISAEFNSNYIEFWGDAVLSFPDTPVEMWTVTLPRGRYTETSFVEAISEDTGANEPKLKRRANGLWGFTAGEAPYDEAQKRTITGWLVRPSFIRKMFGDHPAGPLGQQLEPLASDFRLDPTFGATSHMLVLGDSRLHHIALPFTETNTTAHLRPYNEELKLGEDQVTSATIETFYPGLNTTVVEKAPFDFVFTIVLQETAAAPLK